MTFSNGKIFCHSEDGQVIYFPSDTLEAESGAREKLMHNENGSYTLTTVDQVKELYDSTGNLISLTDSNGNTISLIFRTAISAP